MGRKSCLRKEERWNDKGWAEGGRETILEKHVPGYVVEWWKGPVAAEAFVEKVFQEYHYYIHWTWEDHIEPMQLFAPYDPNATPEPKILTEEEAKKKRECVKYLNEVSVDFFNLDMHLPTASGLYVGYGIGQGSS